MVLSELRQNDHLSASAILGYVDCSLAYKFGRIDKLPMEFKSDALEFGTCIHRVLEEFYSARMIGEKMLLKDVHQLFETTWTGIAADRDDIRYAEGNDFKSLLMYGKDLLTAWYNKLPDDQFTILAIEEAFTFTLPGVSIPIIGAMDLVEEDSAGTIIITDFKTSGRAYSKDEVDQNQQLTMYQIAAKRNGYADREILLRFDTLIKTKTPKFEQYWTVRSELDERRLIKKAVQVWDGITKGVFVANDLSWRCKGCAYKKACDDYLEAEGEEYDQASNQ
ncbi:PD-(D/E)XK nuclease family protein [uncultured Desulfosarcina sp.]|uniref:RecB family exonuclease n=1 Tax=uncultured Desulfosarcina sp. TaxID=218289 RepID=UPI0029C782FF|nr:PD-(D/E)XK nuclease family protein [uncultured Desulfosarcina sp.]